MIIPVSVGEALDKYSILEIKHCLISDVGKKREIDNEIAQLASVKEYCFKYNYLYTLLYHINEKIWIETDGIKLITPDDASYALKSYNIFEMNQQRFRIKNFINNLEDGSIKEQKSYSESSISLRVVDIGNAIPVIYYLAVMYDVVVLENAELLRNTFKTPNIIFKNAGTGAGISEANIMAPEIFKLKTIDYLAGGKLGDFIHQLSVVYEKFLQTGQKGRIFMSENIGDPFQRGVVETHKDILPLIGDLPYIESLHVHNGEKFHFNLSSWRAQPDMHKYSWQDIFFISYDVAWGRNAWISTTVNEDLKDVTLISTNPARWNSIDWNGLFDKIAGPIMFLNINENEFEHFCKETKRNIPAVKCKTFSEIAIAIQSCKMLIATLSMPLAIADGMKKNRLAIMPPSNYFFDNSISRKTDGNWIDENTVFESNKFLSNNYLNFKVSSNVNIESFSQFGEDLFIAQYFPPHYKGICIDIGATDGVGLSNTYYFEQRGWKAICVEANPAMIPALKKIRVNAVHCAVGQYNNREVDFNVVTLADGNQTAISGLELDQRLMQSHAYLSPQVSIVKVQERTLDNIIADFDWVTHIDFISIDTEGTELAVLKGLDISRWNVKMFCIENNYNEPEIEQYLALFGYRKIRRHEVNDFYTM
jgi:FkbM family methyltransferase